MAGSRDKGQGGPLPPPGGGMVLRPGELYHHRQMLRFSTSEVVEQSKKTGNGGQKENEQGALAVPKPRAEHDRVAADDEDGQTEWPKEGKTVHAGLSLASAVAQSGWSGARL